MMPASDLTQQYFHSSLPSDLFSLDMKLHTILPGTVNYIALQAFFLVTASLEVEFAKEEQQLYFLLDKTLQ